MADEDETGVTSELVAAETPIETPRPKKQPTPQRSKAKIAAASTAKSPRVPKIRAAKAEAPVSKATAKDRTKSTSPLVAPAATAEMADLAQLEQENKQLRAALAEKLRAENADLRKRLDA